jgi:hypothetical protein
MRLLDDEGRLFGVVNVIDALVVLFVIAVVVAGAGLVFGGGESEPGTDTTYVTLDLGTHPAFVASAINEGDSYSPGGADTITITDLQLTPEESSVRVHAKAEVEATVSDGSIEYDGAPLRLGRTLNIRTDRYEVSGQIRDVNDADGLNRVEPTVVLRDRMPTPDARELAAGDEIRIAGRTIATIQETVVYATENPNERAVYVAATLQAHRQQDGLRFGSTPVRRGQSVTLPGEEYTVDGRIERTGGGLERGNVSVLLTDTVDVETANRITEGDIVTTAGDRTATVEQTTVYNTGNPDRKRLFVGLSLSTVGYAERPLFGETPIQEGRVMNITDGYTLSGPIERVGAVEQRGFSDDRTVTLRVEGVREDFADAIEPGMADQAGGETIAEVTDVEVEPAVLVLQGDDGALGVFDHPIERDVTITADLSVRSTTEGVRFKGTALRQGETVTLDLQTVTVEAEVVTID